MGALTPFLQSEFRRRCPPGWECGSEVPLLPTELIQLLGYDPRADVVLSNTGNRSRIWIEFEVSRADPVANHAKFATASLFIPQSPADHFVAMVSPHIDRGRRNLAAATIHLMRRVGMSAFQTTLLPLNTPSEIKELNHLAVEQIAAKSIDVGAEIDRALTMVEPVGKWGRLNVHLVGDILDVLMNLRGWNEEILSREGQRAWGKRAVTYFVFDPSSGLFAPSKFCAYLPIQSASGIGIEVPSCSFRMSIAGYAELNDGTHVMDGNRAQRHLCRELGLRTPAEPEMATVTAAFARWCQTHREFVSVRNDTPTFLVPPTWYAPVPC